MYKYNGFCIPSQNVIDEFNYIYNEIFIENIYEHEKCTIHKGDTVIDLGANVGLFSKRAFDLGAGIVVAVEADDENYKCLIENMLYANKARFIPVNFAIYVNCHGVTFNKVDNRLGGHYIDILDEEHIMPLVRGSGNVSKIKKRSITLDILLKSFTLRKVNFIKLDIEGSEYDALLGGEKTIKRFKPRIAMAAYHKDNDFEKATGLLKSFRDDYEFKLVDKGTCDKVLFCY